MDYRFPKSLRLTKRVEFDYVFEHGRVAADGCLVIHAVRAADPVMRIGISISKRVGNAPTRNRWKRLIREAFRTQRCQLPSAMDVVVRPKRDAIAEPTAIAKSLLRLARRLDRMLSQSS